MVEQISSVIAIVLVLGVIFLAYHDYVTYRVVYVFLCLMLGICLGAINVWNFSAEVAAGSIMVQEEPASQSARSFLATFQENAIAHVRRQEFLPDTTLIAYLAAVAFLSLLLAFPSFGLIRGGKLSARPVPMAGNRAAQQVAEASSSP